jgi:hypothetical protein
MRHGVSEDRSPDLAAVHGLAAYPTPARLPSGREAGDGRIARRSRTSEAGTDTVAYAAFAESKRRL